MISFYQRLLTVNSCFKQRLQIVNDSRQLVFTDIYPSLQLVRISSKWSIALGGGQEQLALTKHLSKH